MNHLVIAIKTTEGGMWILPHVLEARRRGTRVTVITPSGEGRLVKAVSALAKRDPGVAHCASPFDFSFARPLRLVAGLWRLRRVLGHLDPSAILYHLYATALAIRLATIGMRIRKVYMVAGPLYLDSRLISATERILARLDDVIICGSHYTLQRYLRLGLSPKRLMALPYGVDTSHYRPSPDANVRAVRGHLGLQADTFVAAMVAFVYAPKSLVYRGEGIKGHRYLLEAWPRFHHMHPDTELLMVGSGFDAAGEAYRSYLIDEYASSAGLAASGIRWLGSVNDVRDTYIAADISVSPSLSENHGAALEASSMAVPSIVSDAGALSEAVTPRSGWVFAAGSAEALLKCLNEAYAEWHEGSLSVRGTAARRFMAERFDVTELAHHVIDCVEE